MSMLISKITLILLNIIIIVHSFHRLQYDTLEERMWNGIIEQLKSNSISLKVFYHASKWKQYWKEVIQEHMSILDGKRTYYAISSKYPYGIDNTTHSDVNQEIGSAGYYWVKQKRFASILDYANEMV